MRLPPTASEGGRDHLCGTVGTLGVWGCNPDPGAGPPTDADVLRNPAVWALSQWRPAALGCLCRHLGGTQRWSSRVSCEQSAELPTKLSVAQKRLEGTAPRSC